MSKIYTSVCQLMGNTPLLELTGLEKEFDLKCRVLAKLECCNIAGSAKDRVALAMIRDGEEKGLLTPGGVIIEPTSGNTGIGLAAVAATKGYRTIIVMPDSMSIERQKLMKAYGAELVLTPGALGMQGAVEKQKRWSRRSPTAGSPVNLRILPMHTLTRPPPALKSGRTPTVRWIFSLPA